MAYQNRLIDPLLNQVMPSLPAVAIEGAKGVGKTETSRRRANTVLSLNDPRHRASVAANFDLVAELPPPVLIDEWQLEPQVWERIRQAVDADPRAGGRFLLAGSAGLAPGTRIHSGAGRIVSMVMRPMALSERGLEAPTVSLRELMLGEAHISGRTAISLKTYVDEILRSGFPGIRGADDLARTLLLDGYLARIVERDLPEQGINIRRPAALRAWLRAYGAATSTCADYTKIGEAATPGETNKPAKATVEGYRDHLTRLFILDPLEAWIPAFNPLKRLTVTPKHHLVDPALAARLVGVGANGLLLGEGERVSNVTGTWLGALFESLAVQSVRAYAEAQFMRAFHLRTKGGEHEIDLIVETAERDVVAFEVKLADTVGPDDAKHLHWLKAQVGDRLKDAIILNTGPHAYRRPDGIAVVPLALLGP